MYLIVKFLSVLNSFVVWRYIRLPSKLAKFGKMSLVIYVGHTMTVPLIYHYSESYYQAMLMGLLSLIALIVVAEIGVDKFLTNPLSSLIGYLNNNRKAI